MALSFSRKAWEKARPKEAKDSGVGKAMDALLANEKAMGSVGAGQKAIKSIENAAEALENIAALRSAFDVGLDKAAKSPDKDQVRSLEGQVAKWRRELVAFEKEAKETLTRACQVLGFYEGDIEAARIGKEILAARNGLAKVAQAVDKVGADNPKLREAYVKAKATADTALMRVGGKDTRDGMQKYVAKMLAGYIAKGYISAGELPDPDGRDLLAAQATELRKDLNDLALKFA